MGLTDNYYAGDRSRNGACNRKHTYKNERMIKVIRQHFDLEKHVEKKRECLRCEKEFMSSHAANRMCGQCTTFANKASGLD